MDKGKIAQVQLLLSELLGTGAGEAPTLSFRVLATQHWNEEARHLRSKGDAARMTEQLIEYFGDEDSMTITPARGEDYRAHRKAQPRKSADRRSDERHAKSGGGKPLRPATINREMAHLHRILAFGVERKILAFNPFVRWRREEEDNIRQGKIATESDLALVLRRCDAVTEAYVLTLIDSGPRRLEAWRFRWDAIEKNTLEVFLTKTKTGVARRLRLSRRAYEAIDRLPRICPWVFANPETGQPFSPRTLLRRFQEACDGADIKGPEGERLNLHSLRHSFAYKARRYWKLPERTIMKLGGWKTRAAFDRYGISDIEEIDEAYARIDAEIERARDELRSATRMSAQRIHPTTDTSKTESKVTKPLAK